MNHYNFSIATVPFEVDSDLPICFSRSTLSAPIDCDLPVTVSVNPILEVPAQGKFFTESAGKRFYRTDNGIAVELIDYNKNIVIMRTVTSNNTTLVGVDPNYLLPSGMINGEMFLAALDLPYILLNYKRIVIHAASIEVGSQVIAFSAPSGTGKSTQARLWEKFRGVNQLNGDKVAVGIKDGIPHAFGFPFAGTSGICHDYDLPLRAIVFLRQSPENSIIRLRGASALREFMNNAFGHESIPSYLSQMIICASEILAVTPVYLLSCTPDERAVETLENALKESK